MINLRALALLTVFLFAIAQEALAAPYNVNATGSRNASGDTSFVFQGNYTLTLPDSSYPGLALVDFGGNANAKLLINTAANAPLDLSGVQFMGNSADNNAKVGILEVQSTGLVTLSGNPNRNYGSIIINNGANLISSNDLNLGGSITLSGSGTITFNSGEFNGDDISGTADFEGNLITENHLIKSTVGAAYPLQSIVITSMSVGTFTKTISAQNITLYSLSNTTFYDTITIVNNGQLNANNSNIGLISPGKLVPSVDGEGTAIFNDSLNLTDGAGGHPAIGSANRKFANIGIENISGTLGFPVNIPNSIYSNNLNITGSYIKTTGTVVASNIVLNTTYNNEAGFYIIDLSNATFNLSDITSITINVTQGGAAPSSNTEVAFIKTALSGTDISSFNNKISVNNNLWTVSSNNAGTLIYNKYTPPFVPSSPSENHTSKESHEIAMMDQVIKNISSNPEASQSSYIQKIIQNFMQLPEKSQDIILSVSSNSTALQEFSNSQNETNGQIIPPIINTSFLDSTLLTIDDRFSSTGNLITAEAVGPVGSTGSSNVSETTSTSKQIPQASSTSSITSEGNLKQDNPDINSTLEASAVETSAEGISAGSAAFDKLGAWASANIAKAIQGKKNGMRGFKSISKGATLGADTMINDRTIIGIAISNLFTKIKHKNSDLGDGTVAKSWGAAMYGHHSFKGKWFLRGTFAISNNNIKSAERRVVGALNNNIQYGYTHANYNVTSLGGDILVGYSHTLKNGLSITPSAGTRITRINKVSYKETGNTGQNKTVSVKASNNISAIVGLQLSKPIIKENLTLTPEIHAEATYAVNPKQSSTKFSNEFDGNSSIRHFAGSKPSIISGTIGTSLSASSDRIECGVSYDVALATKYVSQQVSARVKVKF